MWLAYSTVTTVMYNVFLWVVWNSFCPSHCQNCPPNHKHCCVAYFFGVLLGVVIVQYYLFKSHFVACWPLYYSYVQPYMTHLAKLFWFGPETMPLSRAGPYHGLWPMYAPTKCIAVTLIPWAMRQCTLWGCPLTTAGAISQLRYSIFWLLLYAWY